MLADFPVRVRDLERSNQSKHAMASRREIGSFHHTVCLGLFGPSVCVLASARDCAHDGIQADLSRCRLLTRHWLSNFRGGPVIGGFSAFLQCDATHGQ